MNSSNRERPIFILGNPRSGTSLLRLMLHSHSQICIPPESHFFLWLEEKYKDWNIELLDVFVDELFQSTKFETWGMDKHSLALHLANQCPNSYSEVIAIIYKYYCKKGKDEPKLWGDKNSLWLDKLSAIKFHFPNAFIIHIIRDGRDVACSYKKLNTKRLKSIYAPKLTADISEIAAIWNRNNLSLACFLTGFPKNQIIRIKYEDLLTFPEKSLEQILGCLELDFEQNQLEYYTKPVDEIEPSEFLNWKEKLLEPLDLSNIGKYKDILTQEEINKFETVARTSLMKYDYL